jgi:hypothetical protein
MMVLPQELYEAFKKTIYLVNTDEPIAIRIDHSSQPLQQLLVHNLAKSAAIITCDNPRSQLQPAVVNSQARNELRSRLHKGGFTIFETIHQDPHSKWPDEYGFLVLDLPQQTLDQWLVEYGQLAAVTINSAGYASLLLSQVDSTR